MSEEAYPEAAEVLRAAGWAPHNAYGVYTRGTLVFGHPREGEYRSKDWAAIPPGHPQYDPINTPDTAVEAALWLVAKERKSGQGEGHETDSEIVPEGAADMELRRPERLAGDNAERASDNADEWSDDDESGNALSAAAVADDEGLAHESDSETPAQEPSVVAASGPGGESAAEEDGQEGSRPSQAADARGDEQYELGADGVFGASDGIAAGVPDANQLVSDEAADAAFDEIAVEGADLLELPPPEPEDFAPDEIPPADEVAEAVAIFGDNLPMQRLLLIGRVTQIAGEMKAILQEGWTVDEFRELQNHIMRMSQGIAPEDEHARARFAAISEASRAMSAIDAHAERQVEWINDASRDEIASYKPEEGWP